MFFNDPFFTKEKCDRCYGNLKIRILSWFNDDVICMNCKKEEHQLRNQLKHVKDAHWEGSGVCIFYIRQLAKQTKE